MIILNVFDQEDYDVFVYGNPYSTGNIPIDCYPSGWQKKCSADWVFNLAFFNFDNYKNRLLNCAGRTLQYCYNPNIGVIGYNSGQTLSMPTIMLDSGSRFAGWKWAIKDGIVQSSDLDKTSRRARNMNGLTTCGKYIHVQSDRQTEAFVAGEVNKRIKALYKTSIKCLFIEDAGGSTQQYSAISKLEFAPEGRRAIATVIGVKRKAAYTFTRTLYKGLQGNDVMILQQALGGIEIDGSFGPATDRRLRQAQKVMGLTADGYAGPMTIKTMGYGYERR